MLRPNTSSPNLRKSWSAPFVSALIGWLLISCATATPHDGPAVRLQTPGSSPAYARLTAATAADRVLVVAPHIDDEVLGAGGYVADAIDAGADVYIVYLTGGDYSRIGQLANHLTGFATVPLNRKAKTRMAEAQRAATRLGLDPSHLLLLGYPDRGLAKMLRKPRHTMRSVSTGQKTVPYAEAVSPGAPYRLESLHRDLESTLNVVQPTVVIGPIEQDRHPDHRAAAIIIGHVLRGRNEHPARIGYLIHAWLSSGSKDLLPPSRMRDEDWLVYPLSESARHTKKQALAEFKTQQRSPYLIALFRSLDRNNELFLRYQ